MIMVQILLVQLVITLVLHVMLEVVITVILVQRLEPLLCLILVLVVLLTSNLPMFAPPVPFLAIPAVSYPLIVPHAQVLVISQHINASAITVIIETG